MAGTELRTRTIVALGVGAVLLVVGAAAAMFAGADQAQRVADDALELRRAQAAVSHLTSLRANLAVGVVAADDPQVSDDAFAAAHAALDDLAATTEGLLEPDRLAGLRADLEEAEQLAADGNSRAAAEVARDRLLPEAADLSSELASTAATLAGRIQAEREAAGRAARLSSFTVALAVPVAVLWVFRRSARRRLAEERLRADLEREREVSRTREELIAGLSHELRTPLTGIYGYAETMLDAARTGEADPELVEGGLATILDESNRLHRMVEDILVAARSSADSLSFRLEPTPVGQVVNAVLDPHRRAGHHLTWTGDDILVLCDPDRFQHLLRNLVANAIDHGAQPIEVRGRAAGVKYELVVADRGPGVPPDVADHLFEPFLHTDGAATTAGSVGLGLAVATALARGMKAELDYERQEDETRFVVVLDLAHPATASQAQAAAPQAAG